MNYKTVEPSAPLLVESIRSVGYSFESAMADIIDNSIGNYAKNIKILYRTIDDPYIAILDDGIGMNESELITAMRYGSHDSLEQRRDDDLGRFGLGLKMASLSQCRELVVISKKDGAINAVSWNLDVIFEQKNWALIEFSEKEIEEFPESDLLKELEHGTLVLWRQFDRLELGTNDLQKTLDEKLDHAQDHIALVFHRYLNNEIPSRRVHIEFNYKPLDVIDPFLTNNPATQPQPEQVIRIDGEVIKVKPFILPYQSKLNSKDLKTLGIVDNLQQNQGFYIYRNRRLILWGTWLRIVKRQELNRLARIRIDIPNSLDSLWGIDIKKSTASLPPLIRQNLKNIIESTVGKSERVYKYRGRKVNDDSLIHVWNVMDDRGKYSYKINKEIPHYKILENLLDETQLSYVNSYLEMIEDSFPFEDVYYRTAKSQESLEKPKLEFEQVYEKATEIIESIDKKESKLLFLNNLDKIDYFQSYPDVIKKIREVYGDE